MKSCFVKNILFVFLGSMILFQSAYSLPVREALNRLEVLSKEHEALKYEIDVRFARMKDLELRRNNVLMERERLIRPIMELEDLINSLAGIPIEDPTEQAAYNRMQVDLISKRKRSEELVVIEQELSKKELVLNNEIYVRQPLIFKVSSEIFDIQSDLKRMQLEGVQETDEGASADSVKAGPAAVGEAVSESRRVFALDADVRRIVSQHQAGFSFDGRIAEPVSGPEAYRPRDVAPSIRLNGLEVQQVAGLSQALDMRDKRTNYCGYYVVYNIAQLLSGASLTNRALFVDMFGQMVSAVKEKFPRLAPRYDNIDSGVIEYFLKLKRLNRFVVVLDDFNEFKELVELGILTEGDERVGKILKFRRLKYNKIIVVYNPSGSGHWVTVMFERRSRNNVLVTIVDSLSNDWLDRESDVFKSRLIPLCDFVLGRECLVR